MSPVPADLPDVSKGRRTREGARQCYSTGLVRLAGAAEDTARSNRIARGGGQRPLPDGQGRLACPNPAGPQNRSGGAISPPPCCGHSILKTEFTGCGTEPLVLIPTSVTVASPLWTFVLHMHWMSPLADGRFPDLRCFCEGSMPNRQGAAIHALATETHMLRRALRSTTRR